MVANPRPEPAEPQRSFIARFFIFLFKFILLIAVIAAGGAIGTLAASWIRSNESMNNSQTKRLNDIQLDLVQMSQLENDLTTVSSQADFTDNTVSELKTDLRDLTSDMAAISDTVAAQAKLISAQEAQVATLTEAQTVILDDLAAAQTDVEDLFETTAGLRTNLASVSNNASAVDSSLSSLERQISSLETNLEDIETAMEGIAVAAADVSGEEAAEGEEDSAAVVADAAPVQVDLTLVRVLGHIARAKIHLLENDSVSAGAAIEAAIGLSDDEALTTSLQTAMDSLDSKPAATALALDEAWNALEALLDG